MIKSELRPVHPGEILREDYLAPMDMSVNALAKALHVPATRMNEIVRQNRGITADTAPRLARYFGTSERFWMNLQMEYELRTAQIAKAAQVEQEVDPHTARKPDQKTGTDLFFQKTGTDLFFAPVLGENGV